MDKILCVGLFTLLSVPREDRVKYIHPTGAACGSCPHFDGSRVTCCSLGAGNCTALPGGIWVKNSVVVALRLAGHNITIERGTLEIYEGTA